MSYEQNKGDGTLYQKLNHEWGDDYENWLAAEQANYYREVIVHDLPIVYLSRTD